MKEKTPDGDFFTYDAKSREIGGIMSMFAIVLLVIEIFLRIKYFI
ncbi:MAG: hypothetical protein ACI9SQ_000097 [Rubritalea sp.]|jgi:hypothetical protein